MIDGCRLLLFLLQGIELFAAFLRSNTTIQTVVLAHNKMRDEGALSLANHLVTVPLAYSSSTAVRSSMPPPPAPIPIPSSVSRALRTPPRTVRDGDRSHFTCHATVHTGR